MLLHSVTVATEDIMLQALQDMTQTLKAAGLGDKEMLVIDRQR